MITFAKPVKIKTKIITKNQLTKTVFFVQYQLLEPQVLSFVAGQTFMITVSQGIHRAMSIASSPQQTGVIDSLQDTAPMGPGSKWLLERNVGDEVEIMAPLGRFVIDQDSPRKRVLVATGTGIAPFRSMLMDSSDGISGQKEVSLYWGLRFKEDMYLWDELQKLDADHDNLIFYFSLSKPPADWSGISGHVTDHVLANEKDPLNCDYYLCGNKKMILEIQERLTAIGVPREHMKFDPYY